MWQKLRAVSQHFKRELTVYQCVLRDPRTPKGAKVLLGLAIGYDGPIIYVSREREGTPFPVHSDGVWHIRAHNHQPPVI